MISEAVFVMLKCLFKEHIFFFVEDYVFEIPFGDLAFFDKCADSNCTTFAKLFEFTLHQCRAEPEVLSVNADIEDNEPFAEMSVFQYRQYLRQTYLSVELVAVIGNAYHKAEQSAVFICELDH